MIEKYRNDPVAFWMDCVAAESNPRLEKIITISNPMGDRIDLGDYFSTARQFRNFEPWPPMTATEARERQKACTAERVPVLTKIIHDYREELEDVAIEGLTRRMFELVLENPPRTMTRSEWKQARKWLRSVRRKIT